MQTQQGNKFTVHYDQSTCAYINSGNGILNDSVQQNTVEENSSNVDDTRSYSVEIDVNEYIPTEKQVYERFASIINNLNSLCNTYIYKSDGTKIGVSKLNETHCENDASLRYTLIEKIKGKILQCCKDYELMKLDIKNKVEVHNQLSIKTNWNSQHFVSNESLLNLNAFIAFSNIIYDEYLTVLALFNIDPFINFNV